MRDPAPPPRKGTAPNFRPISVVAKWLDGLRCHLAWSKASAQATLCYQQLGLSLCPPKSGRSPPPIFGLCLLWPNGCMYQDTTWYGGRRHCLRWGPISPPLKGHSPQFSANVRCGQSNGWAKMPLGMEVDLGLGDFVFDGDPAPPEKKHSPHPIFGPCLLWPNGWMDQDATWYGGN